MQTFNSSILKRIMTIIVICLLSLPASISRASDAKSFQGITVSGTVTDAAGEGMPGVNVVVSGTTTGVITDVNGKYTINVANANAILSFSFVGYITQQVPVGNRTVVDVTIVENTMELEEIVVIGYGTVRKKDLSGAVTMVNSEELIRTPSANLSQALQGNVPGMWTNQSKRSPGDDVTIALRGNNSFEGTSPLFVVDGFPIASDGGLNSISTNDIESISVLKDASSTAMYGARAANGVVLITTKSGKAGKKSIEVNAYMGFKSFTNPVKMMNGEELAELRREAYINDGVNGGVAVFRDEELAMLKEGRYTNWWDEVTGTNRRTDNLQVSFTGGTENTRVMVSGTFYNEKGVVNNSDFIRGGLRANILQKLGPVTLTSNNNIGIVSKTGVTGESILYPASIGNPLAPVRQANGEYYTMIVGVGNTPWANPKAYTELINSRSVEPIVTSSLALEYELVEGLKIRTQLSGELDSWKENYYVPIALSANHVESGRVSDGFARVTNKVNYNWLSETTVSFRRNFGIHGVEAIAGFSAQKNRWESVVASASGFAVDTYETWNLGASAGTARKPTSDLQEWSIMSWIGRVVYTLNNKYIITGNFRADGSSRFGSNNKWGFFPSGAVAWKASEEEFIRNLGLFDELKLRASYGLAGNAQALKPYTTQARLSTASYNWDGKESPGYYVSQLAYDNLKWETTRQFDIGLDVSIFERRLNLTYDYYLKNTVDLVRELPILAVSGFQKGWANMGDLRNQGMELAVNGLVIDRQLKWNMGFSIAGNRNELVSLGDGTTQIGTQHWVGKPINIGDRYMIDKIGIWQLDETAQAAEYKAVPGDVKYAEIEKDKKIDDKDRDFHGNLTPNFYGSWNNQVTYKGFDLTVFFTYEQGRDIYNGNNFKLLAGDGYDNHRTEMLDRWSPNNPTNDYPRAALATSNRSSMRSTEFLEDASFIKLRNITLGYSFPEAWVSRFKCQELRLYLSGTNLFTITGYSGYDPEDSDVQNNARNAPYPSTRTFTAGLSIRF